MIAFPECANQYGNFKIVAFDFTLHCGILRLNLNGCRKYTVVGHWSQHNHTGITDQVDLRIRAINVSASTIWKLKEAEYYPLEDKQCNGTIS